ncbi:MAG: hypothetical protein ACQEWR_12760 [Bacillota bacterium]
MDKTVILTGKEFMQVDKVDPNEELSFDLKAGGKPIIGYMFKVLNPKKKVIVRQALPKAEYLNLKEWTITFYNLENTTETIEIYPVYWNG